MQPKMSTMVWLVLVALTLVTYAVGEYALVGTTIVYFLLALAVIKALLVAEYFMGLRKVSGFWRPLIASYLAVLGLGIALAFTGMA